MKISDWVDWVFRVYKQALHAMSPKLDLLPNSRTDALRKLLSK